MREQDGVYWPKQERTHTSHKTKTTTTRRNIASKEAGSNTNISRQQGHPRPSPSLFPPPIHKVAKAKQKKNVRWNHFFQVPISAQKTSPAGNALAQSTHCTEHLLLTLFSGQNSSLFGRKNGLLSEHYRITTKFCRFSRWIASEKNKLWTSSSTTRRSSRAKQSSKSERGADSRVRQSETALGRSWQLIRSSTARCRRKQLTDMLWQRTSTALSRYSWTESRKSTLLCSIWSIFDWWLINKYFFFEKSRGHQC